MEKIKRDLPFSSLSIVFNETAEFLLPTTSFTLDPVFMSDTNKTFN